MVATVLVVDDDELVRGLACRFLEDAGYVVLAARDGLQAVELFRGHADTIAAVISDMNMPRMTGEETFREIRRIRPDVPFLFCSGSLAQQQMDRLRKMGVAGFLPKPYQQADLAEKLKAIMTADG